MGSGGCLESWESFDNPFLDSELESLFNWLLKLVTYHFLNEFSQWLIQSVDLMKLPIERNNFKTQNSVNVNPCNISFDRINSIQMVLYACA